MLYPDSMAYLESPAYQRERGLMKQAELGATPYAGFDFTNYVSLDDGTMVGFVFGHTARYRAAEDFGYNLYRLNPDGTAVFLNAGCRRGGSERFSLVSSASRISDASTVICAMFSFFTSAGPLMFSIYIVFLLNIFF